MKKNPLSIFKTFSIGIKDGILILIILAAISPFVYREVLERTSSNSDVVIGSVNADLPVRPSTPTPEPLTPTATPTPTSMPGPTTAAPTSSSSKPVVNGGFIQLKIENIRADLWTQVQWLAGDGNWYDINGWAGNLTANNEVLWFVGKDHLGAEPAFRWQVYDTEGGSLLATSDPFQLPTETKQTVSVTITLPTP